MHKDTYMYFITISNSYSMLMGPPESVLDFFNVLPIQKLRRANSIYLRATVNTQSARKAKKASGERKTGINPKTGRPYARRKSGMIQAECLFQDGETTQKQHCEAQQETKRSSGPRT